MNKIDLALEHIKDFDAVADIGAGNCWLKRELEKRRRIKYVSLDLRRSGKIDVQGIAHALPFKDKTFDVAILYSIIEHDIRPFDVIVESIRISRRKVLIWTDHALTWQSETDPSHLYEWSPKVLSQLLLKIQDHTGIRLFNISTRGTNGSIYAWIEI